MARGLITSGKTPTDPMSCHFHCDILKGRVGIWHDRREKAPAHPACQQVQFCCWKYHFKSGISFFLDTVWVLITSSALHHVCPCLTTTHNFSGPLSPNSASSRKASIISSCFFLKMDSLVFQRRLYYMILIRLNTFGKRQNGRAASWTGSQQICSNLGRHLT